MWNLDDGTISLCAVNPVPWPRCTKEQTRSQLVQYLGLVLIPEAYRCPSRIDGPCEGFDDKGRGWGALITLRAVRRRLTR